MIYSLTFPRRVLSFQVTGIHSRGLPNFLFNVTSHPKSKNMTLQEKHTRLSKLVHLTIDMHTWIDLALLSMCRESRDFLFRAGYQIWKLPDKDGVWREIAWNSAHDTVAFIGPHTSGIAPAYTHILSVFHPLEAKLVQNLALPSSSWASKGAVTDGGGEKVSKWLVFNSLRKIIVVVDEDWETRYVRGLPSQLSEFWRFEIPKDIERGLKNLKDNEDWENRDIPEVKVTREETGIFGNNVEICLRCFPCPDLGVHEA